ncbi:hypothetical protein [Rhodoluna sp.]|nr:hypothetical protein [Rhodoluna sp.]
MRITKTYWQGWAIAVGIIAASPFIFYWFVSLTLAIGFMSIALSQRLQYH